MPATCPIGGHGARAGSDGHAHMIKPVIRGHTSCEFISVACFTRSVREFDGPAHHRPERATSRRGDRQEAIDQPCEGVVHATAGQKAEQATTPWGVIRIRNGRCLRRAGLAGGS